MSAPPSPLKSPRKTRRLSIDSEQFPEGSRIDFVRFEGSIYPAIRGNSKFNAQVHWNQIQSLIKGSVEAIMQSRPLSSEQYMNQKIFHSKRCSLNADERRDVYSVYTRYRQLQRRDHLWDDVDRVNNMHADAVQEHPPTPTKNKKVEGNVWEKMFMCFAESEL